MTKLHAPKFLTLSFAAAIALGGATLAEAQQTAPGAGQTQPRGPVTTAPAATGPAAAGPATGGLPTAVNTAITPAEEAEIEAAMKSVPPDMIRAVIAGTPADMERVTGYITGGSPDSHGILIRSLALVRVVGASPAGTDQQVLLAVGLRLAQTAQRFIETHSLVRVTVDRTYRPTANARAYKFSASGTTPPAGFELVAPGDRRLEGVGVTAFKGPATDAITGNGLTGVHCFTTEAENGRYRVILMTADLGKPRQEPAPLGQMVTINGQAQKVVNADPSKWLTWAYLTNRPGQAMPAGAQQTSMLSPDDGADDGVVTHQAAPALRGAPTRPGAPAQPAVPSMPRIPAVDVGSTSGGAFIAETAVTNKQMKFCLDPAQNSVLVAAVFEAPAGAKLAGGGVNMARLEQPNEFPTGLGAPHGKPWRYMHRDGFVGSSDDACKLLGLTKEQCDQYNGMVAAGSCAVQLMPNGVVLTAMGYTSQTTHQSYAEHNVLVDLKNPLSREVLLCKLGPGLYVGRAFGCNNPVRIEGAEVSRPAALPPAGPNMLVLASAADVAQRIAHEAEGLPFGGSAPGGPGGDPGVTIPPHSLNASPV